MKKLLVLGSINQDHTLKIREFPKPGQTINAKGYQILFGGKGANQAVAAGRSGAKVNFIAAVGNDEAGNSVLQQLKQDNVDTKAIAKIDGEKTGLAIVMVDEQGENSIIISAGANAALTPSHIQTYYDLIASSAAVLMQLEIPLETVVATAKIAKKLQKLIVVNPAPARKLSDELLSIIDIITPNQTEAEVLTGITVKNQQDAHRAANELHTKGVHTVVITLGKKGVWFSENGKGKLLQAYSVEAIDTVAAGDTFNGALMTYLLEGENNEDAINFACAAAAISVTRSGAQSSIPWRNEIDNFLQSNKG